MVRPVDGNIDHAVIGIQRPINVRALSAVRGPSLDDQLDAGTKGLICLHHGIVRIAIIQDLAQNTAAGPDLIEIIAARRRQEYRPHCLIDAVFHIQFSCGTRLVEVSYRAGSDVSRERHNLGHLRCVEHLR